MSEGKQKFGEKLKNDKKFRFELIVGIWTGLISIFLIFAVVKVSGVYLAASNETVETDDEVDDDTPVLVSEPAFEAEEPEETEKTEQPEPEESEPEEEPEPEQNNTPKKMRI